jgi:hypothetical protein
VGGLGLGEDVGDVAGVGGGAAGRGLDVLGADQADLVVAAAGGRADGKLEVGFRDDGPGGPPGDVDGGGLALERAVAAADRPEDLGAGLDGAAAGEDHEAVLLVVAGPLEPLAGLEPVDGEADMAPAGASWRHLVDEAVGGGGVVLQQQVGHQGAPLAWSQAAISRP